MAESFAVCRLCRNVAKLQDSHLMPKAVYRYLRMADGQNPFLITNLNAVQTNRQVKTLLLCATCEQRLNDNGERWMLRNGSRGRGHFRLREALLRNKPLRQTANSLVFSSVLVPEIDVPKLIYFASSVFWRAAVHDWGGSSELDFGARYESEFRHYLIGEADFPRNASLVVYVNAIDKPVDFFSLPSGSKQDGYFRYQFIALGIEFSLLLGSTVPPEFRQLCILRSRTQPIFLSDKVQEHAFETTSVLLKSLREIGQLS